MPAAHALTETERRFLVDADDARRLVAGLPGLPLVQAYLTNDPDRAVRVRIGQGAPPRSRTGQAIAWLARLVGRRPSAGAWLTVKGRKAAGAGLEVETDITPMQGEALLAICLGRPVRKRRYILPGTDGLCWEVDLFEDGLTGLVIAEIEIDRIDRPLALPDWLGPEITDDPRYSNPALAFADTLPPFYTRPRDATTP